MRFKGRIGAIRRMAMVVAAVVICAMTAAPAQAQCQFWGESWFESSTSERSSASGAGKTRYAEGLNVGGTEIAPCGTSGSNMRVETWLDGAQSSLACTQGNRVNGVCVGSANNTSVVQARFDYIHSFSGVQMNGTWCVHSKHFMTSAWGIQYQDRDSYGCQDYDSYSPGGGGDPGDVARQECEDGGHLWVEDDWYELGGYCEINQDPESPIVMPLTNKQAYKLTSLEDGVYFDIDGDGVPERMAWTAADSDLAFLALDRNGNGLIDNGTELFGNRTLPGVSNGFAALKQIAPQATDDLNEGGPGWVSDRDPVYARLLLWEDRNHNGVSEPDELQPLSNVYTRIGLGYETHNRRDGHGNEFRFRGFAEYRTKPGRNRPEGWDDQKARQRDIYDVFFQVQR